MPVSRTQLSAILLAALFLVIYLPDVGHGFIKDDFRWIATSRVSGVRDVLTPFVGNVGFYRPFVALTFAADYAAYGLAARGYGLTNLALMAADVVLLFLLVRRIGLPNHTALVATGVWAFNFHGVNMALLWISGRTSLLVALFSLATAHAVIGRRRILAGACALAAMLSKEEAVLLPFLFAAFLAFDVEGDSQSRVPLRVRLCDGALPCWPMFLALAVYAVLRFASGAFGPLAAPSYYRFTLSPLVVLRNVAEYADRAGTTAAIVAVVLLTVSGQWRRPVLIGEERRVLRLAAVWVPAMYALTVLLPVRSSLYALLPSIGIALAAAVIGSVVVRTTPAGFGRASAVLIVLALLLVPVYRARNQRWVRLGDLSSQYVATLRTAGLRAAEARITRRIVIVLPERDEAFDAVFGTVFPAAAALTVPSPELVRRSELDPNARSYLQFENGTLSDVSLD